MIPVSVDAFRIEVHRVALRTFPDAQWELQEQNQFRLKARILLSPGLFIDVFYGARTRRIDFALIQGADRVFGMDNLNGWHRHPFGEAEQHMPIPTPTVEGIFSEILAVTMEQGLLNTPPRKR